MIFNFNINFNTKQLVFWEEAMNLNINKTYNSTFKYIQQRD